MLSIRERFGYNPPDRSAEVGFRESEPGRVGDVRRRSDEDATATDWHHAHKGRLVEFGGWSMPVQYSTIIEEHVAVRQRVGLFDISHMGRLKFEGPGALAWLEKVTTNHVAPTRAGADSVQPDGGRRWGHPPTTSWCTAGATAWRWSATLRAGPGYWPSSKGIARGSTPT